MQPAPDSTPTHPAPSGAGSAMIAPTTLYCGKRESVIAEVGGLTHIYPGAYLVQPDGPAAYDAEGADTKADMNAVIAEYRSLFPSINVVML